MASTNFSASAFVRQFSHFLRVDFSCKHLSDERPHELAESLSEHLESLCESVTSELGDEDYIVLYPTLFTTCKADATISRDAHQDRGTFLIGLHAESGDPKRETIESLIQEWELEFRATTMFVDYIPAPSLTVHLVKGEELGAMVVDEWMIAHFHTKQPLLFASENTTIDSSEALRFMEPAVPSEEAPKTGTSAAVVADSASPGTVAGSKKLTPASAILNRLKWDPAFESKDYIVVYEDRHAGLMESPVDQWITESTEETFVPMHRIRAVKSAKTGMIVWHREERIDLISGS